jgi:hypothetical protein
MELLCFPREQKLDASSDTELAIVTYAQTHGETPHLRL